MATYAANLSNIETNLIGQLRSSEEGAFQDLFHHFKQRIFKTALKSKSSGSGDGAYLHLKGMVKGFDRRGVLIRSKYDYYLLMNKERMKELKLTLQDTVEAGGYLTGFEAPGVFLVKCDGMEKVAR